MTHTRSQIGVLLGVTNALGPHLYDTSEASFDDDARRAACRTFQNACLRLDAILKENTRWQPQGAPARPSSVFRPRLARTGDGWLVWYGDDPDTRLEAWGSSPAEAFAAFDEAFTE